MGLAVSDWRTYVLPAAGYVIAAAIGLNMAAMAIIQCASVSVQEQAPRRRFLQPNLFLVLGIIGLCVGLLVIMPYLIGVVIVLYLASMGAFEFIYGWNEPLSVSAAILQLSLLLVMQMILLCFWGMVLFINYFTFL